MSANLPSYRISIFVCSLLMLTPAAALGERLPLKAYTVADGLAHNEINKIVRDSRGFLWFCTAEGLSRFDGYEFTNFGTDQGLPHRTVNDFLETRNGELWVATNAGLVRFDPKGKASSHVVYVNDVDGSVWPMFSVLVPRDEDRRARAFTMLFEGRDGTLCVGTQKGLLRVERFNGRFDLQPVDIEPPTAGNDQPFIYDLVEDPHGSLWAATNRGLCRRWPDGSTARYTERDGLPDFLIQDLMQDRQGHLWAGTRAGGFFQFSSDETHAPPIVQHSYSERDGLTTVWVFQLFETSDKRFWVATDKGVAEFFPNAGEREPKFKTYTQRNGLLYWGVTTLNEDAGGNLWLGSDAGAMKLVRDGLVTYGEQDGLLAVYGIFEDRAGEVCFRASVFGDKHRSVFEGAKPDLLRPLETFHTRYGRFDGRSFSWLKPEILSSEQLSWVGEMVTLQTRNGEWWLGGLGLYRFPVLDDFLQLRRARPLAVYTTKDGLAGQQIFRLFEDSRDRIWVSTIQPNGLAYWQRSDETWQDLTNASGLPSAKEDLARSFGEDAAGDVWIGFNIGVARYHDGSFNFFTARDGLPPGGVMNFHLDHAGHLWLTSSRSGLIRVDHPESEHPVFINYTTSEGLSSNSTEAITEDLAGRIYVSTGRGLDRLDPLTGRFKHFTTADGLAAGPMRVAFRDRQGGLWFGTGKGMSRLFPTNEQPAPPPPVLISGLTIAGEKQHVSSLGEATVALRKLKSNENQLQIDFVGLSFEPGEELRYQYKFAGSKADWSIASRQRTVTLASLDPGEYEFLVRALNSDGVASLTPARLTFTIMPPFWRRWWFVTIVALAIGLTILMLYRYRVARILELANVRTRIASDLHDDIGANLTKISILSEVARQQGNGDGEKDSPLASIARISRESVAAMSDIVWAINPQRDSLRDVIRRMRINAEETCLPHQIELEFDAPEDLDLKLGIETRRCLYLVFKEALNNAARHSGCWRIRVALSLTRDRLTLQISDNGLGFEVADETDGNGLLNMRRRAESLGGKVEIESSVGKGTTVQLRLPYSKSYAFSRIRR